MIGLHENQRKILEYLLDRPDGATLDKLSAHLALSKTATKEHVIRVEGLGLLTYKDVRGDVGRPRRHYMLSSEGHEAFPRQYAWLTNVLLGHLAEDMGGASVAKIMGQLAERVADSMGARFQKATTAEMMAEVTKALNELGYRAQLKQSDLRKGAVIEATNCVYHSVAKTHPELCRFDTKFIEHATGGMNVRLESCIARGGSVCRFCIKKSG